MVSEGTPITPLSCDSLTKSINKDPRPKSPIPTDSTVSVPTFSSPAAPPIKFPSGSSSSSMHTSNKSVASPGDPVHSLPVSVFSNQLPSYQERPIHHGNRQTIPIPPINGKGYLRKAVRGNGFVLTWGNSRTP